ncbi:MAG: TIGR01777 family oxidoreductase [Actinomycetota bacterium]|nr:TIGR01777 family oxidoreductase [Actinomycetota bacterium]
MRVLVSGSSGLIGSELVQRLKAEGHEVTRLVRRLPGPGEAGWDPKEGTADAPALEGHDAVVHLAGAGLGDHRWTESYKAEILHSRKEATLLLSRTLAGLERPPRVMVSGSAVGFYGDRGDEELTEESGPGAGFLAEVVGQWEAATGPAEEAGIRVVHIRSGIVQSPKGGSLGRLKLPFKLGLGGRIGSGRQWLSWVSIDDEVGGILHLLQRDDVRGPVNLTAPYPVRFEEYAKALGRALGRPAVIPTPTLALELMLGRELVREMLLGGQRVLPARLLASGYRHRHPRLEGALAELFTRAA